MADAPKSRRIGRWLAALGVSAAAHFAFLLPLLLRQAEAPPPEPEAIQLSLERTRRTSPPPAQLQRPPAALPAASVEPAPVPALPPAPDGAAAAPSPAPGSQLSGPPAAGPPAPLAGLSLACAGDVQRLPAEQRRKCEARQFAGLERGNGSGKVEPPDIDGRKVQHYQSVMASRHGEGHGVQFGCSIPFGKGKKPKKPPNSLKLGPCILRPPNGMLTRDVDAAPLETPYEAPPVKLPEFRPVEPKRTGDQK